MDPPSDAEVIGRSLDDPEAFGLVYDRHAATVLRFLGRRVGAQAAEGLLGELFRIAFERRKAVPPSIQPRSPAGFLIPLTMARSSGGGRDFGSPGATEGRSQG